MKTKIMTIFLAVFISLPTVVNAATVISYSAKAPEIGLDDIVFLGESKTDAKNVPVPGGVGDAANDAATYLAHDRPGMGQTFTTGSNPDGYTMSGFWLKNVMYDTPSGNGTWWYINNDGGGAQLEIRVVDPALQGDPDNFVLAVEDYIVTGTETGNELMPVNWNANKVGTGTWVHFQLGTPVTLAADTQYGFDVTVLTDSPMYFFETAGIATDPNDPNTIYAGGAAYSTGVANRTNSLALDSVYDGDHTFVVELDAPKVVSYSATAPEIGPDDIAFLGESTTDGNNVAAGNDAATYLAHDRPGMGQTFTTGSNPDGYMMQGFWLKNVKYDTPSGNGTWWYIDNEAGQLGGTQLELRVVDPALQGDQGFVLASEIYTVQGIETGNELMPVNWAADKVGTGTWVHFQLRTPVSLAPDTQYGFDVTVVLGDWGYFFETAGVADDPNDPNSGYAEGAAYSSGIEVRTNSLFLDAVYDGDHAFVVELE
jgi:hypothetical protein